MKKLYITLVISLITQGLIASNFKISKQLAIQDQRTVLAKLEEFLNKKPDDFSTIKTSADLVKIENMVEEFEKTFSSFCETAFSSVPIKKSAMKKAEYYWNFSSEDPTVIVSSEKHASNEESVLYASYNYDQMKLIFIKWSIASKTFPESTILQSAAAKAESAYKKLGSKEAVEKSATTAKASHLAAVKMEPSVVNDPSFEAQIKKALTDSKIGGGKEVLKINIQNKDWNIKRNEVTGTILSRSRNFSAVVKEKDGGCTLIQYSSYKQDYVNGNYGTGYIYMGQTTAILCENAK